MQGAHARLFSPSSLDRAMVCTASVSLIDQMLTAGEIRESDLEGAEDRLDEESVIEFGNGAYDDVFIATGEETSFSAEGTVMHELRQICLEMNLDPFLFVGSVFSQGNYKFEITEEMADRLIEGLDFIRQYTTHPNVEDRVDLSTFLPGQFGTVDTWWLHKKTLFVKDFKNGVGRPVDAIENRQLLAYAIAIWDRLGQPDLDSIVLMIDQPRAGGLKDWEITPDVLRAFGDELKNVFKRVERGDVEFVPTKKGCQYCPVKKAKRGCAAYNQWMTMMMGRALLDPNDPHPAFEDPDQISRAMRYYIIRHASDIRAWLERLYKDSLQDALAGDPDPGSKAVEGDLGDRYFTDEEAAKRILVGAMGRKAFKPRKIIGITEIEKTLKPGKKKVGNPDAWEALLKLVDRPPGSPKLVPADHHKPAYVSADEDDFDDLN
jgi:hypothetical protein